MTTTEFADLLSRLVGKAEDAGLDPEEILAEMRAWPRRCGRTWRNSQGSPTLCHPAPRSARRRAL
jgi:hypothetical protein